MATASIFARLKPVMRDFAAGETLFATGDAMLSGWWVLSLGR
ncbi:hypothetical protein [Bosea beijingensis]